MSSSWLAGFLSGVIATIIGFLLTMFWDIFKYNRDAGNRDRAVLTAVKEEMISNLDILSSNQKMLQQELTVLPEKRSMVGPLCLLQEGIWDLVKINLPSRLTKDNTLLLIRKLSLLTNEINEIIRSRENYRINNGAMSNYSDRIKLYDEILLPKCSEIIVLFEELQKQLG